MGLSLEHFLPSLKVMARGTHGFGDIRGPLNRVLSEEVIPTCTYVTRNATVLSRAESRLHLHSWIHFCVLLRALVYLLLPRLGNPLYLNSGMQFSLQDMKSFICL